MQIRIHNLSLLGTVLAGAAVAQGTGTAPAPALRDMTLGGPGATESPFTVDAGHLQVESELLGYGTNRFEEAGTRFRFDRLTVGSVNFRVGLLDDWEAQLMLDPFTRINEEVGGVRQTFDGFGDTTIRVKHNVWGNDDDEETAFGVVPYLTLPTSEEDLGAEHVEGGVVLALGCSLPGDTWFEVSMTVHAGRGADRGTQYEMGVSLGRTLHDELDGYVEFVLQADSDADTEALAAFGGGLVYRVTPDVQIYFGGDLGLTPAAEDWSTFVGLAFRI